MIRGKPVWTFIIYSGLARGLTIAWPDMPLALQYFFLGYGLYLFVNYWFRVRPERLSKIFGGGAPKPPDRATLGKWLCGNWDLRKIASLLQGYQTVFLEQMDADGIVEKNATASDLADGGGELIRGKIMKLMSGPAPGFREMPMSQSQLAVANRVYDDIRNSRYGELYAVGRGMALFNATTAWYAEKYDNTIAVATHVIDDIAPDAGEAFRVRAFAFISLERYEEAVVDLRRALASVPQPGGAVEPLAAIEKFLAGSTR